MRKETITRVVAFLMLTAGTLLTTAPSARAKLAPEQQCAKSRYEAAAKYAQCHQKALAKHFAVNDFAKLNPALSKCRVKYAATWPKLQKKALGTGSTCDHDRFFDFGVSVTDRLTGLEWEKKTDNGTYRDEEKTYTWFEAYSDSFLQKLQDDTFPDWRLPTIAELQTILLPEPYPCATSPCIDAVFGPTVATDYWASTTLADNPDYAWGVFFGTGEVSYGVKTLSNSVRAVRGGL